MGSRKETKREKAKRFISRLARKLLPAGAGLLVGLVAPQLSSLVASYISEKLNQVGIRVDKSRLNELGEEVLKKTAIEIIGEKLEEIILKQEEKTREEIKAAVEYALRDLYHTLQEAVEYLREYPEIIPNELARIGINIREIGKQIKETQEMITVLSNRELGELRKIEKKLDKYFMEMVKLLTKEKLTIEKIKILSRNQVQMVKMSSRYDIEYQPELYVNRVDAETNFEDFRSEMEYGIGRKRNLFLILADAGLGKTWFMAHIATKLVEECEAVFYIPLRYGFKEQLETIFGKPIEQIKSLFDELYEETGKITYLFLDGLDELESSEREAVLRHILTMKNKSSTAIILSCRTSDWIHDPEIRERYDDLEGMIYDAERDPTIETPLSVKLEEFTEPELEAAVRRYGIPNLEGELRELAKKPYILRLIAQWYWEKGKLPDFEDEEESQEFIAGKKNSILSRMGITGTTKEALFTIVEKIVESGEKEILLKEAIEGIGKREWATIRSSGLVIIREKPWGTTIELNPAIAKHIAKLTIKRKTIQERKI
mgnify:CR=1 FL=1